MPEFTRTVVQRYVVEADALHIADKLIGGILDGVAEAVEGTPVRVGQPVITRSDGDEPGGEDAMYAILGDASILDEVENENGACFVGWVRVDNTDIPEQLIAWRDAAVREALAGRPLAVNDRIRVTGIENHNGRVGRVLGIDTEDPCPIDVELDETADRASARFSLCADEVERA